MFLFCLLVITLCLLYVCLRRPDNLVALANELKCEDKCMPVVGHAYIIKGSNKGKINYL